MQYEDNTYLTSDRFLDVEFLFVEIEPNNWRIYILSNINYGSRSTDAMAIHRLIETDKDLKTKINRYKHNTPSPISENDTVYYICWSAKITDLKTAKSIAKAWSEITAYYIRHGGSFPEIQKKLAKRNII